MIKGFASWASASFSNVDEQEAAFVLQKGYFVSRGRHYNLDSLAGEALIDQVFMHGACYAYTSPRLETAMRLANTTRDFSDTPELLLKFV